MDVIVGQAGVDEAGCGALMGDLVAAAVILPDGFDTRGVNDSKKLTHASRRRLYDRINESAVVGVGRVSVDELNVLKFGDARRLVFQRAVAALATTPKEIIVDGTGFFDGFSGVPFKCVPKADGKYASVAAASIVAKVTRDDIVDNLCLIDHQSAQRYQWASNKGYPTAAHLKGIKTHGITTFHRRQFGPCVNQPGSSPVDYLSSL